MKKVIALVLCAALCLGLAPAALADGAGEYTISVGAGEGGTVTADGMEDNGVAVAPGDDVTFTITPEDGFAVSSVTRDDMAPAPTDITRNLVYDAASLEFSLTIGDVRDDITLAVEFKPEHLDDLLSKSYAVLADEAGSAGAVKTALAREFGYLGYAVGADRISVSDADIDLTGISANGYGTFSFAVTVGGTPSDVTSGYIVAAHTDVIFRFIIDSEPEIRVANENGEFGAPAMDAGTIEVFGVYNAGIEGVISQDVRDAFMPEEVNGNRSRYTLTRAFYRAQLHIANTYATDPESGLNWFMFDLIQDNALCVEVSASSTEGALEQRTWQWELNRYADLTEGPYTSDAYFANDVLTLSLPTSGIGGAAGLSVAAGSFPGYTVTGNEDGTYCVEFLSNFYDRITLDLRINGLVDRQLTICRVGVHIADYRQGHDQTLVLHGTQPGSIIDFPGGSDGAGYCIYATYYIPDAGTSAPYGLYVTYTWANGATTTEIVPAPVHAPSDDLIGCEGGVFLYHDGGNNLANVCDYLLYSAADDTNAPVRVSVTVLKDDPTDAGDFGGVWFGSGAGVTWTPEG